MSDSLSVFEAKRRESRAAGESWPGLLLCYKWISLPMNYAEQQRYLEQSRIYVVIVLLVWIVLTALCLKSSTALTRAIIGFVLVVVAVGFSLAYTPDYLHLTVNPRKRLSWGIKIRWRIAAALVVGLLSVSSLGGVIVVV